MRGQAGALALTAGGMIAMAAALGIGRFAYTPILPLMVEGLGLSQGQAGLIASANFAGYLVGALLAASRSLPGPGRAWLLGALGLSAATTAMMGALGSVLSFALARFVGGVASAFVLVMVSTLVLDRLTALGRSDLGAMNFAGVGAGIFASSLAMLALTGAGATWRTAWAAAGGLSFVALGLAAMLIPGGREPPRPPAPRHGDGSASPGFLLMAGSYGLFGFGYVITATFIVALVRADEATRPLEPYVWMLVGLAGVPSITLWTWVSRHIGLFETYALSCLLQAVGVATTVLWRDALGVALAAVVLGSTIMGITALGLAGARQFGTGDPRRLIALMTSAFGLGQIIGPSFAGLAHDWTGSFVSPSLAAAGALVVAAGMGLAARRHVAA